MQLGKILQQQSKNGDAAAEVILNFAGSIGETLEEIATRHTETKELDQKILDLQRNGSVEDWQAAVNDGWIFKDITARRPSNVITESGLEEEASFPNDDELHNFYASQISPHFRWGVDAQISFLHASGFYPERERTELGEEYVPPCIKRKNKKRAKVETESTKGEKVQVKKNIASERTDASHEDCKDAHKEHELEKIDDMLSNPSRGRINIYIRSARQYSEAVSRVLWLLGYRCSWIHEDVRDIAAKVADLVCGDEATGRKPCSLVGPAVTSKLGKALKNAKGSERKVVLKEFVRRHAEFTKLMP